MGQDQVYQERFKRLWHRAEEMLEQRSSEAGRLSPEDVQEAVHDLQVYQIELVLQNEELRRAQAELEAARDKYTNLYDFAPIGYFTLDETGRILEVNLKGAAMLGLERTRLTGRLLFRYVAPGDQDAYRGYLKRLFGAEQTESCEIRLVRRDGTQFEALLEGAAAPGEDQSGPQCRLAIGDVSRRVALDEEMHASEARFRGIFEGAPMGISITDLDGRVLDNNPALQALLGYSAPELSGTHFRQFTHPDDLAADLGLFEELAAGRRDGYTLEKRYLRKDGRVIWGRLTLSLVRDSRAEPRFAIAMLEDLTGCKEAQAALVESEKLAVAGKLSASLAHEINNPLQSVTGCLALAQEALHSQEEDAIRYLEVAGEELRRITAVVVQLRDLHRLGKLEKRQETDVNDLMERVLELNRPRCRSHGVQVEWRPARALPPVSAVPDQIQQVFLNLLLNALEAMPDGGRLFIRTETIHEPPGVRVSFRDQGEGIPEHLLPGIFDSFFTTRPEGLGLGLYICRNIVMEHGGRIDVESRAGEGTTFTVWLPR
jgi:PAS domain S-box-containing protein